MAANVHGFKQDILLTNYARMLAPQREAFIAERVFPVTDVPTKSGKFLDVQRGFAAASPGHGMYRADGQREYLSIPVKISQVTGWEVEDGGLSTNVDRSSAKYAEGNGLDLRRAQAAVLDRECRIIRERVAAGVAFNTTTFSGQTSALSGTDQWSDLSNSDPISNAQDAISTILSASGEMPDTLIVGYDVHKSLIQNEKIVSAVKYTRPGFVGLLSNEIIAQALGVQNYIVGASVGNTAEFGQTETNAYIWGKFALFCKLRPSPQPMTPGSCLQRWRLMGSTDGAVSSWLPSPNVEQLQMSWCDQFAAPTTALGYLYSTVVA